MRYAFIEAERRSHTVRLRCRVIGVSKAGYYAWRHRAPSARRQANTALATHIGMVHQRSRRTYGSPRVTVELRAQGVRCSENRVARVMRCAGIRAKGRRRFRLTTDSRHGHPVAPNVLARQCAVDAIPGLNRVWASDITYVPTHEGWL